MDLPSTRRTLWNGKLKPMKLFKCLLALLAFGLLQGCIAFPPLIQVEHKHDEGNQDLIRRLDAIDHRLDQLEQKAEKK
jgi:hypothetical protein